MDESEATVNERAAKGDGIARGVCSQLLSDRRRYLMWHAGQDTRMTAVAEQRRRESQILALRTAAVRQVHATALIRYLREYRITGIARDQTLLEFHAILDPRDAAIAEHRNYLLAASSHLCSTHLLDLAGDARGLKMVQSYETVYGQFFSMFCDRARNVRNGRHYLLSALIPEARASADGLRARILRGELMPPKPRLLRTSH